MPKHIDKNETSKRLIKETESLFTKRDLVLAMVNLLVGTIASFLGALLFYLIDLTL